MAFIVPPNPETILAGFGFLKSGNRAPSPTDKEQSPIVIIPIIEQERKYPIFSVARIVFRKDINPTLIKKNTELERKSFWKMSVVFVTGDISIIQNLPPSRLKSGKTNLVVRVDVIRPIAQIFKNKTRFFQYSISIL